MKIIDKTPLVNEKGELGVLQRIQGMLQFGLNWPNELAAQKVIVIMLDRLMEKGYTLIRNIPLGQSGIVVPIILLGPGGIFVIHVTQLRGMYQAKGDNWGTVKDGRFQPAPVNLIQRTIRMAKAVQSYIERQGVKLPTAVEPVLIAAEPGMHIESVRPNIKVVMIDAVKQFASGLMTGRPNLTVEMAYEYADRIINPRPPKVEKPEPVAPPAPEPRAAWEEMYYEEQQPAPQVSRSKAIFDASQEAKPFNPADFDFAMEDQPPAESALPSLSEASPAHPLSPQKPRGKRIFGMTVMQLAILGGLVLALICIGVVFVYLFFIAPL